MHWQACRIYQAIPTQLQGRKFFKLQTSYIQLATFLHIDSVFPEAETNVPYVVHGMAANYTSWCQVDNLHHILHKHRMVRDNLTSFYSEKERKRIENFMCIHGIQIVVNYRIKGMWDNQPSLAISKDEELYGK